MASYGNTVLTSAGIALVKRVIANSATFEITKVATSSDSRLVNATISTIEALTTLPSVQQTGKVTAFDTSNSKQIGLKCEFTNQGLTNKYTICGVGIYAKEAGKSEILFAVAPAKEPETMPAKPNEQSALFTFSLNMYVVVGQASAMTITATTEGVVKSINGTIKPDANGNVTLSYYSQAEVDQKVSSLSSSINSLNSNVYKIQSDLTNANGAISNLDSKMPRAAYVPVVLGDNTDLNNMKTCGFYMVQGGTSNSPVSGWIYVKVMGIPTRLQQFVWHDLDPAQQWCRIYDYDGKNWTPWTHYTKAL